MNLQCKYCGALITPGTYYCSNCGKILNDPPFAISTMRIIWLSVISVLLPPFGLIPGVKYMLKNDTKATMVGLLLVILTFLSFAFMIYFSLGLLNNLMNQLNSVEQTQMDPNQLNQLKENNQVLQNLNP